MDDERERRAARRFPGPSNYEVFRRISGAERRWVHRVEELAQLSLYVAVAGPNGAGKKTLYAAHLQRVGLRFVNADDLARELEVNAHEAAEVAKQLREVLVAQVESFVFETATVFSDPVGDKLEVLRRASARGYTGVLCFIGLDSPELCDTSASQCACSRAGTTCLRRSSSRVTPDPSRISPARPASCRT